MSEVRPLRPEDPELVEVRQALQRGRRAQAFRLLAAGLALTVVAGAALTRSPWARNAAAGDVAGTSLVSLLTYAAALFALLGLGLVGIAIFALVQNKAPG